MSAPGFGSENIVFVPAGQRLRLYDLVNWKRYELDTRHYAARLRPAGLEALSTALNEALDTIQESKDFADRHAELTDDAREILASLSALRPPEGSRAMAANTFTQRHPDISLAFWLRFSDTAAESFHPEDYEDHDGIPPQPAESFPIYGSVHLEQFDSLEIPMPQTGDDAAFALDIPPGGLTVADIDRSEPLPIAFDYCGARGASPHGESVNIDTKADTVPEHLLCTPLHRIGETLFATLYLHFGTRPGEPVLRRLAEPQLDALRQTLLRSGFTATNEGPCWSIFDRDGDCVHLYHNLPGHESEGFLTMPPFAIVAQVRDGDAPALRAEFLRALLDASGIR